MIENLTLTICDHPKERRQNMFYWRGRYFRGLVCPICNSLWDDPADSFMAHVTATSATASEDV